MCLRSRPHAAPPRPALANAPEAILSTSEAVARSSSTSTASRAIWIQSPRQNPGVKKSRMMSSTLLVGAGAGCFPSIPGRYGRYTGSFR